GPDERGSSAKDLPLLQRSLAWLQPGLALQHADSAETVPVASAAMQRHQRLGQQSSHAVLAIPVPTPPQVKALRASQGGSEAQWQPRPGEARPGEGYDQGCAVRDRLTDVLLPDYRPPVSRSRLRPGLQATARPVGFLP